jgi:hypothetical protein
VSWPDPARRGNRTRSSCWEPRPTWRSQCAWGAQPAPSRRSVETSASCSGPPVAWEEALFSSGRYFPIDLTRDVVRTAERLYGIPERGDRLIAASAVELGAPLITRDPEITKAAGVTTIW